MLSAVLGMALVMGVMAAAQKVDARKDAVKKADGKKDVTEPKAPGMVVTVEVVKFLAEGDTKSKKRGAASVTTSDKRKLLFEVDEKTIIVGPRMGVSDDRLIDDRLKNPGSEITVRLSADKKRATFVRLGYRKSDDKDRKDRKDK